MKIYISADIEGITGVTHWDETELGKGDYAAAQEQMTSEVIAACEGALEAGATEVWVKDAHDSGRNLIASRLPPQTRLIRAWSGHPFSMLQELDNSFQSLSLIGYHSGIASAGSPLAHTMSGHIRRIQINGSPASEFTLAAYTAALAGVPLVFLSGDGALCREVKAFKPSIATVAVKEGVGDSTVNLHPQSSVELIRQGMREAVGNAEACQIALPGHFSLEVEFRHHFRAYQFGFFPGARQTGPFTVCLEHNSFFEVLRFILFAA